MPRTTTTHAPRRRRRGDDGSALTWVVIAAVVLIVAVGGVLVATHRGETPAAIPTTTTTTSPPATGPTTTTTDPFPIIAPQVRLACVSAVDSVSGAVQAYIHNTGSPPPAGPAWATSNANGGPYLDQWPQGVNGYLLEWTGSKIIVFPPGGGTPSMRGAGTLVPPTGCFAR